MIVVTFTVPLMPKSQYYSSLTTKTRKEESAKRGNKLREIDFNEMNFEAIEKEKETHEFEDLSRRIIGAATCPVK